MNERAAAHLVKPRSGDSDLLTHPRNAVLLGFLPAQLDAFQTAHILGFQERDIRTLTRLGLLNPLGSPAPNAHKYYHAAEILKLANSREWLSRARQAVYENDIEQNAKKKTAPRIHEGAALAA